jgi:hypothetical protein
MKPSVYTKIFVSLLVVLSALALISYSRSKTASIKEECSGSAKCGGKKVQNEYIIWESFSTNLLSGTTGCNEN